MVRCKVTISNPTGLHLHPAGIFCKEANRFGCRVMFEYGNETANAKSVLGVLGACIKSGDEIEIVCDGEGEEDALQAMISLVESGLGE